MKSKTKTVRANAWTYAEKRTLAKHLRGGYSAKETANVLGRTVGAVWNMKHKMKADGKIPMVKHNFRNHNSIANYKF